MVLKFKGGFGTLGDVLSFIESYIDSRGLEGRELFNKIVKFSAVSQANKDIVFDVFKNGSTVRFRDFCKAYLGFDYWVKGSMEKLLFNHNNVNEIDSAMGYYKNIRLDVNRYISRHIKEAGEDAFIKEYNDKDLLDNLSKELTDQFLDQFKGECWDLYFDDMVREWFDSNAKK